MAYKYDGKHYRVNATQRKACINADYKCSICRSEHNINVHHIDKNPGNNNIDNLIVLCRACHLKKHGIDTTIKYKAVFSEISNYAHEKLRKMAFDRHISRNKLMTEAIELYINSK